MTGEFRTLHGVTWGSKWLKGFVQVVASGYNGLEEGYR